MMKKEFFPSVIVNMDDEKKKDMIAQLEIQENKDLISKFSKGISTPEIKEWYSKQTFEDSLTKAMKLSPVFNTTSPAIEKDKLDQLQQTLTSALSSDAWLISHEHIEFTKELGSGRFSNVFKGLFKGEKVAIKLFKKQNVGEEEILFDEFKKEFQVMARIKHKNIVGFIGACLEPKICLVMEFCSGGTLYDHLRNEEINITWEQGFDMMIELVEAVSYLHSLDPIICHRDIKTMNILLNSKGECLLGDFGLARMNVTENKESMAKTKGTYAYLAPELFFGDTYTAYSDVYSCGIVIWEIAYRIIKRRYNPPFFEFAKLKDFQILYMSAEKGSRPTVPESCPVELSGVITQSFNGKPTSRDTSQTLIQKLKILKMYYMQNRDKFDSSIEKKRN